MFQNLDVFRLSHAMAVHAGTRQAVIAQNLANSDTPGYAARDVAPFSTLIGTDAPQFTSKATRVTHLNASSGPLQIDVSPRNDAQTDPNGNSVSVESEMLHAVSVKRQHDRAVAIYKSALGLLRTAVSVR
ncbi:flagellar basal-body rod protein; FlgB [Roseobacter sp. AzwK-3b]|uniref:FlgB family protein n=1 Tax=Roseobacter sp. AzwK-3b TaxID=351016 RepID=UPI0001569927|nr:FlgB family protein [Roseobacter sp. AzwK-3b]EDM73061.1 flagellar basal-body rod protein; FlgB [Roseobacter sp. AzwK-3b]